jgi:NAD(P)-dependent dehydrogenase (short-subunit alcohol dehydrogenase family)
MTCLMDKPTTRLLFMSSDSHWGGDGSLRNAAQSHSYGNSKLHDVMLAKAFARRWGDIQVISMHPGWVRTKMGGMAAPGSVSSSAKALAGWASGENSLSKVASGAFVTQGGETEPHSASEVLEKQEELMGLCKQISGVSVPGEK